MQSKIHPFISKCPCTNFKKLSPSRVVHSTFPSSICLSFRCSFIYSHPTRQLCQILVMYPSDSIHSFIFCPLIHSCIPPSYHAFIHSFFHHYVLSSTYQYIYLFILPFTNTFNLSSIYHLPIHLSIDPFTSNDSSLHFSTHTAIHLSTLPSFHSSFHHSIIYPPIQSLLSSIFTSFDPSKHSLPLYPCCPHQEIPH